MVKAMPRYKAACEMIIGMFGIAFAILVLAALVSICGEIVMRVRLTRAEPSQNGLAWWRRGGDQVSASYQEFYPNSRLPLFRHFTFWLVVAATVAALVYIALVRAK